MPNVSQDATEKDPIMAKSDEAENPNDQFRDQQNSEGRGARARYDCWKECGSLDCQGVKRPDPRRKLRASIRQLLTQLEYAFDQVDLATHVTVHEVDFLPASMGTRW